MPVDSIAAQHMIAAMRKWILKNWERLILNFIALGFLGFTFCFLFKSDIPAASASFGMAFMSLVFGSVARFRRFKGLGFEAELWDEKQLEASRLVEKLKDLSAVYSEEILLNLVTGIYISAPEGGWKKIWALYDEFSGAQTELDAPTDFTELRETLESYFIYEAAGSSLKHLQNAISKAKNKAQSRIEMKYKEPADREILRENIEKLKKIPHQVERPLELARERRLARTAIGIIERARKDLLDQFSEDLILEDQHMHRLRTIESVEGKAQFSVRHDLLAWAEEQRIL